MNVLDDRDWPTLHRHLDDDGRVVLPGLLSPEACDRLAASYPDDRLFRSTVVMARHGFGRGEYRYFAYPLPEVIETLRHALYAALVPLANRWNASLGIDTRYPDTLDAFIDRCHRAGQTRPTPLLLAYREDDYNCLHQDLYGELVFPIQVAVLLSRPDADFTGGEFVVTETRSGEQCADVVPLTQGDAIVFAVNERPAPGRRGVRRVAMRHGVSRVRSGRRHTVGIIFHDAR